MQMWYKQNYKIQESKNKTLTEKLNNNNDNNNKG